MERSSMLPSIVETQETKTTKPNQNTQIPKLPAHRKTHNQNNNINVSWTNVVTKTML